jgi:hypothetical protein
MDGAGHLLSLKVMRASVRVCPAVSTSNLCDFGPDSQVATGAGERMGAFLFELALLLSPLHSIRTLSSR